METHQNWAFGKKDLGQSICSCHNKTLSGSQERRWGRIICQFNSNMVNVRRESLTSI
jgi:hypothetical protein